MTPESESPDSLLSDLVARGRAYVQLVNGSNRLLAGNLAWTERILLRLVHRLYTNRLRELVLILPPDVTEELLREKRSLTNREIDI